MLQDEKGICIGSNSYPVFIDFFIRDDVRVNSNMIIIGKSGSGKSFCTKSILSHLAADNTKVFILDPEREYTTLTKNLHGNFIDVGNAGKGRFNPFHVYPAMLDEDDGGKEFDDTFESHLRFLESFFKVVMEGIKPDPLESLNGIVAACYKQKGIDRYTDFRQLKPEHFPVFQDLYELAKRFHANAVDDFSRINYRILVTYLEKFAEGGRFSGLWNGPATIRTNENFVTFDFMTLLANKNNIVADAQMLLVFKYLDGEIIKNRDYNTKHKVRRKIIIVVDEAHVFINEQRPIALDFMFNMAKRIRKYDGMQIIITQNVKDFVGSPAIAKKSAAIINASQYSMIFALAPNDMTDLVTLYKNSGEINKAEQNQITTNARGQCFFISGPMSRTLIHVETSDEIRKMFE
jgi:type IV secretory pathway VirB4 component